jgi:flagellum-specific ATP synthase
VADSARAILDGHIVLSRRIADAGVYPAIDIEGSVSRVVTEITDTAWRERIRRLRQMVSAYNSHRDLISIGAYQRGSDPRVDEAIERWPQVNAFVAQDVSQAAPLAVSRKALETLTADKPDARPAEPRKDAAA